MGSDDAEGDHQERNGERGCGVEDEVMTVDTEELTHHRQLGQKEIMEQINVECATANEL